MVKYWMLWGLLHAFNKGIKYMKKLMMAALAAAAMTAFAEDEETEAPIFWGFGNYGLYSGYQLYGSLVNPEPTLQG